MRNMEVKSGRPRLILRLTTYQPCKLDFSQRQFLPLHSGDTTTHLTEGVEII